MNSYADPEQSYRRGFMQGAVTVIDEAAQWLPAGVSSALYDWVHGPVHKWRMDNRLGLSKRDADWYFTAALNPPRHLLRLGRYKK
jgi:hypothetical protein